MLFRPESVETSCGWNADSEQPAEGTNKRFTKSFVHALLEMIKPATNACERRFQKRIEKRMRVLIVKLSSLGDVIHAAPVVHDIHRAFPDATIDWVVEPAFAPLVRRIDGMHEVIECALRRWTRTWRTPAARAEWRLFRTRLRRDYYDAVIDLQGLTKSAIIARLARGVSYGLTNRTEDQARGACAMAGCKCDPGRTANPRAGPLS